MNPYIQLFADDGEPFIIRVDVITHVGPSVEGLTNVFTNEGADDNEYPYMTTLSYDEVLSLMTEAGARIVKAVKK